ncbi:MAG: hypothetical protein RMY30_036705 [Nostoc sp. CmiSLP01]|nr:hypothetical protein [Nostoc sp. CmiSLP01]MDZ8286322.1 hypothetical protein [Nostoc sp. ChiSLP01]
MTNAHCNQLGKLKYSPINGSQKASSRIYPGEPNIEFVVDM